MSHLSIRTLSATLDGSLEGTALEQATEHLSGCIICQEHQERLAMHDHALRRLFGSPPADRVLNDVTRRSEALATAIIRGLPVPPLVTSVPLEAFEDEEDEEGEEESPGPAPLALERGTIERLDRFTPPDRIGPATVEQETTATPANASEELPPAREPSRSTLRLDDATRSNATPLDVTPRFDTEHATAPKAEHKPERKPETLVETYDAFNDFAYAGPAGSRLPPMLGRPQEKKEGDAEQPPPRKEYRHGGVRREPPSAPARENPAPRSERPIEAHEEGFGVKRATEPAWARMGLRPDPHSPGVYRDPLTGAAVTPPADGARRLVAAPSTPRRSRTALIATLAVVGGIVAVVLALRLPTAARLSVQFGRPGAGAPAATPTPVEIHEAGSRPPVDVAVPPGAATGTTAPGTGALATEDLRVCGQVLDTKGRAIAGALFTVAGTMAQARSDAAGHFCLGAPAGTRVVEVMDPRGAGTTTRQIRVEFVADAPAARVILP